jgi:hypothetical protein
VQKFNASRRTGAVLKPPRAYLCALAVLVVVITGCCIRPWQLFPAAGWILRWPSASTSADDALRLSQLRGVNYYPSHNGWYYMWTDWDAGSVNRDFGAMATRLHANLVRLIVPADSHFGYPRPRAVMLARLAQAIALAHRHGLCVNLTLFDDFTAYGDTTGSKRWASAVTAGYANDRRIAFIDLQNELDNTDPRQVVWARAMVPYVRSIAGNIPLTVSVASDLRQLKQQVARHIPVDFYDFHMYQDPALAYATFRQARRIVGAGKPLIIGESGYSTLPANSFLAGVSRTRASQEAAQDQYLRTVEYAAQQLHLPLAMPWIYSDFTSDAHVPPGYLGSVQQFYGLLRPDGTVKPAGKSVASIFAGKPVNVSFNNGFEQCDNAGLPTNWRQWQDRAAGFYGVFACDAATTHTGKYAARITASASNSRGTPALYLSPVQNIAPGHRYVVTVWAKKAGTSARAQIALSWFTATHRYIKSDVSAPLADTATGWTQLRVRAPAPAKAMAVEIHLQAGGQNTGAVWFDDVTFAADQ